MPTLPSPPHPSARSVLTGLLVGVLAITGVHLVTRTPAAADAAQATTSSVAPRTWVVDAVDDAQGSRWESPDTRSPDLTITVGDTITWRAVVGTAGQGHDLVSMDDASDWTPPVSAYIAPGGGTETFSYTFKTAGTYAYLCSLHTSGTVGMRGFITVQEAVADNAPPTASPMVSLSSGTAPTTATFMAHASDPDGDPLTYAWDFGTTDDTSNQSTLVDPMHAYPAPGSYLVTLEVSDGRGGVVRRDLTVTIGGDDQDPGAGEVPPIEAIATRAASSRQVSFSTEVTTTGQLAAYSHGLSAYPGLTGAATLVRRRDQTTASIEVAGLKPRAAHLVHVHEQSCATSLAGAHFRFDETQPFREDNEIWLPFTADDQGDSAIVPRTMPQRAGDKAVSVVIHDPDNPSLRIGCADLAPSTVGLTYVWSFGDGTTAVGADPDHTYAADGTYTATVTVGSEHAAHGVASVTDTVVVDVRSATPLPAPQTRITGGPDGVVGSNRARFWFAADTPGSHFDCRLDGAGWIPCQSGVTYVDLGEGPRILEVRAVDQDGRADATPASRGWTVDTTGPRVRGVRPSSSTRDRTPTIRARVTDRYSSVHRGNVVLRLDGRRLSGVRLDAGSGRVTSPSGGALAPGRHIVRLVVDDALGNRTSRTWQFRVAP